MIRTVTCDLSATGVVAFWVLSMILTTCAPLAGPTLEPTPSGYPSAVTQASGYPGPGTTCDNMSLGVLATLGSGR
jgi:hypothetical protein